MSGVFQGAESAAAKAVGTDLLADANEPWRVDAGARILSSVALVGSTNPGDAECDVRVGSRTVATIKNTTGGANLVPKDTDRKYLGVFVPRSAPVQLIVTDAGVANVLCYEFVFKPPRRRSFTRRRVGNYPRRMTWR